MIIKKNITSEEEISKEEELIKQRLNELESRGFLKKPTLAVDEATTLAVSEAQKILNEPRLDNETLKKRFVAQHPDKSVSKLIPSKTDISVMQQSKLASKDINQLSKKYDSIQGKASISEVKKCIEKIELLRKETSKILIGQEKALDSLIRGIICNGHVLLEGMPGLAKTLLIRALGQASGCDVKRVQFTVDLLPTDIVGINSYTPGKGFKIIRGPIFANFLIADEINRSPPKTQSALIEAMQEKQVTISGERLELPNPFFVMATQNPLENAGVYPLPEAQVDRFLFKVLIGYPKLSEEKLIMESNMTLNNFDDFQIKPVISPKDILYIQDLVKKVYLDERVQDYILDIVERTRKKDFNGGEYISYGASPRATIALYIASKANALMFGRSFVLPEDVREIVYDVLRHRLILSYKARLENINSDDLIKNILEKIEVK